MATENNYFDQWLDTQKQLWNNWETVGKNFQQAVSGNTTSNENETDNAASGLYNSWVQSMGNYFNQVVPHYPLGIGQAQFGKLFNSANLYTQLYDYWTSFSKQLTPGSGFPENIDLFQPASYQKILNKMFGFNTPDLLNNFQKEAEKFSTTWKNQAQNFCKPWAEPAQQNLENWMALFNGQPTQANPLQDFYNTSFNKLWHVPAMGQNRESMTLLTNCLEKFSTFYQKSMEFQHQIYQTGQTAMGKITDHIAEKIATGTEIKHYDEFFRIWSETNEEIYGELFKTDEFASLQGGYLEAALDARKHFQQLLELSLKDYPVPVRSEMDSLYKTIYDLKKRVKTLEQAAAEGK